MTTVEVKALRRELAGRAMQGILSNPTMLDSLIIAEVGESPDSLNPVIREKIGNVVAYNAIFFATALIDMLDKAETTPEPISTAKADAEG